MNKNFSGQQLGIYQLGQAVGVGQTGTVYETYEPVEKRKVALKVLKANLTADTDRFTRELEQVARLDHPHILRVLDYGTDIGHSFIVMRLLDEGSLQDRLKANPVQPLNDIKNWLIDIASALDHAHKKGLVHGDVKPSNILFDSEGDVYVADFGITKVLQETGVLGQDFGTPTYITPEQWQGAAVDARTDNYALGVLAYVLLTGKLPFEAATLEEMKQHHLHDTPTPASELQPMLPAEVDKVIQKVMSKNPEGRYETSGHFVESLLNAIARKSNLVDTRRALDEVKSSLDDERGKWWEWWKR